MTALAEPAFVRDDPLMGGLFAAFMSWLWDQPWAHDDFRRDTGITASPPARTPLDRLIDDATGANRAYAEAFFNWGVREHWGASEE